jgi:hypothetical protein
MKDIKIVLPFLNCPFLNAMNNKNKIEAIKKSQNLPIDIRLFKWYPHIFLIFIIFDGIQSFFRLALKKGINDYFKCIINHPRDKLL